MKKTIFASACVLLALTVLVRISSSATYDPWVDLDDNGLINIFDVVTLANSYQTTGDPTKNVTISGRANKLAYSLNPTSVGSNPFLTPWIPVDGYSKLTVCLRTDAANNLFQLITKHPGGETFIVDYFEDSWNTVRTYDVPNQEILIQFFNYDGVTRLVAIDIYLIP